jgi:hypothetical protein
MLKTPKIKDFDPLEDTAILFLIEIKIRQTTNKYLA